MSSRRSTVFTFLVSAVFCSLLSQVYAVNEPYEPRIKLPSSPFSAAIKALQKQIGYEFESVGLLRRAMTHPSYSEENNKALSILGVHIIETAVSLRYLGKDVDTSAGDLNHRISEISEVVSSCANDGRGLGLEKVVRVSSKTNSSIPGVVCGAFRAMVGAIALDSEKSDDAGRIFWTLHREVGKATVL
ncbi:protein NUCLEAR FUSION DEFECTIVE 2 [Carica papaya]|uniref:protein NUCLEAR FUSION DEFECTIVE 2 n=1 Tax=Carica papaya TaxID=3649 RepID=UPI000B8D10B5|nr:protein NUCLEAR FUSION DEFECTIVE 2 [Carica papaya]